MRKFAVKLKIQGQKKHSYQEEISICQRIDRKCYPHAIYSFPSELESNTLQRRILPGTHIWFNENLKNRTMGQLTVDLLNMQHTYFGYFRQFGGLSKLTCFISVGQAFFECLNFSAAWSQRIGVPYDIVTMQQNSQNVQNIL